MNDQEISKLFKQLAGLYELELETAKILFQKIVNILHGTDLMADDG